MNEIVIISGKGGTGKTSITASFAHIAVRAVMADCDVDAADLHLLLGPKVKERGEFKAGKVAIINKNRCTLCGLCLNKCRFNAVKSHKDGYNYVDETSCEGCKVCEVICPSNAIKMEDKISGDWFIADSKKQPIVYAHLRPGEENSGKLVSLVRSKAKECAKNNNIETIIIDGPPGIGCPVIASVGGTNRVLIVTEPTQSGLHDLKRIAKLTRHFKIAISACINKYDLNSKITNAIEKFCEEKEISVIGKIPYDINITKAMLEGLSIVEYTDSLASQEIKNIWKNLNVNQKEIV